jgi:hypothetical protein
MFSLTPLLLNAIRMPKNIFVIRKSMEICLSCARSAEWEACAPIAFRLCRCVEIHSKGCFVDAHSVFPASKLVRELREAVMRMYHF